MEGVGISSLDLMTKKGNNLFRTDKLRRAELLKPHRGLELGMQRDLRCQDFYDLLQTIHLLFKSCFVKSSSCGP